MMKNSMKWLAIVIFTIFALGASAQTKPLKLGHIEGNKLIAAMPETEAAQKELEKKQAEIEAEMTSLNEQYKTKFEDYNKNASTYSDIIRSSKEQELSELVRRIQSFEEIATNELKKTQEKLFAPIMEKANNAIKEVGKENGFTYIFDLNSGSVIYFAENSEDVLPLVKKKLGLQ